MRNRAITSDDDRRLIGREVEQLRMLEVLDRTLAGEPSSLLVIGPAGSGRSALTDWLLSRCPATVDTERIDDRSPERNEFVRNIERRCRGEIPSPLVVLYDPREREFSRVVIERLAAVAAVMRDGLEERSVPVLIVVVGDADTLASAAGSLGQELPQATLRLEGFSELETFEFVRRHLAAQPAPHLVEQLRRVSAGLPGPMLAILRRAQEQRRLRVGLDGIESAVPLATLTSNGAADKQTLQRITDKLSEAGRRAIEFAACLGPRAPIELFQMIWQDVTPFDDLLDELVEVGILDEDGDSFWFIDARSASSIVEALPVRRRQQLHAAIATAATLTAVDRDMAEALFNQAQLAGAKLAPTRRAEIAERTAALAEAAGDWPLATQSIDVLLGLQPDASVERLNLLVRAGEAAHMHLANRTACRHLDEAFDVALAIGERQRAIDARLRSLYVRAFARLIPPDWAPSVDDPPAVHAWYLQIQADQMFSDGKIEAGFALGERAAHMARRAGIPEVESRVASAVGLQYLGRLELTEARRSYRHAAQAAARGSEPLLRKWPPTRIAFADWLAGEVSSAAAGASAAADAADAEHLWSEAALAHAVHAAALLAGGDLDRARQVAHRSIRLVRRSGYRFPVPIAMHALVGASAFAGDEAAALEAIEVWREHARVPVVTEDLVAVMLTGVVPQTQESNRAGALDLLRAGRYVLSVELGDWTDNGDLAAAQLDPLIQLLDRGVYYTVGWPVGVARAASVAAHWAGDDRLSREFATNAITHAALHGDAVTRALAEFDVARWPDGNNHQSMDRLAKAVRNFDRLGMTSWASRAQRVVDHVAPWTELLGSAATRVLLYTDLVGSTSINVRVGDQRFVALIAEHQAIVDECAAAHRGVRFHNTGDGFGLWFASADDALECARSIHRRFQRATYRHPEVPLDARIGVAAGKPMSFDGDLYGTAVVRAARVCQLAGSGEVIVAAEVLDLAPKPSFRLAPAGSQVLKGFPGKVNLFRLLPTV